ncbi:anaerobic nitric oxide reductase transcription regulator [Modicisalibacter xianhensis]|uniref:Anaerobic nitric oxide reductase transcription regulator n=1 Tax=Modicisalibacter xianhensis TaxID=442341 RepID=A0A4R8G0K5_9GAMM|nr:nitric oxide reductase transcriptional regulator NorR [Halomonas xianhensis]TDX29482.1 anaerobic nitric oxide reductase transcription regulator [Halomonas xianhensis]
MTSFLITLRDLLARLGEGQSTETLHEHWARLLAALVGPYPADASTLMVATDDGLQPVAVLGLPDEVCGRRFTLAAHPRLAAIAAHRGVCRFPPDSPLPDPFDGLIDEDLSDVHDCLGVALRDGDRLTGLLTLDALEQGRLASLDEDELLAAASLLGTCLRLATQLSATRSRLSEALDAERQPPAPVHWHSPAMRRLDEAIALVAPTDMSVLLHGETGVGKERIVRQLHGRSARHQGPLVQVNCAALPEQLIESELFGHRRGAFSGAIKDHRGHFAMADGGTLMLDEIGELPLALQPKLLRVLQEGEIQPLGSERVQHVDVRIIAVTNRDLAAEVAAGRFREDLYHRLSAFPLEVPALRERREDIPLLAGSFLEENRIRLGLANLRLAEDAELALLGWQWPGNVRELEHTLSRAALRALGDTLAAQGEPEDGQRQRLTVRITRQHLDLPATDAPSISAAIQQPTPQIHALPAREDEWTTLRDATDDFQRRHIRRALASHGDNWAATARALGVDSGNLHRLGKRLGLK